MKLFKLALALALVFSAGAWAQHTVPRLVSTSSSPVTVGSSPAYTSVDGTTVEPAIAITPVKSNVADLPTCNAERFGAIASVTDGNGATDCTVGGSTTDVACECSGTAWTARYTSTADTSAYVLITKAGQQSLTASGAGNDITLTSVDDVILAATDDTTVAGDQFAVNTTTAVIDAGGSTDEVTIAAGSTTIVGAFKLTASSAPPVACSAGTEGTYYVDSDIHKPCYCNGTNYVLASDDTTTTGCSEVIYE